MNALLNDNRDDINYNIVGMGTMSGKYCIEDKNFWKIYNQHIKDKNPSFIAEINSATSYIPVIVDFDKKEEGTTLKELYTIENVMNVIRAYRRVLKENFEITDDHLKCVYLSKPPYITNRNGKSYVKHGFHLHFPYIYVQAIQQQNIIYPKVSLLLEEHSNIDACIYRTPWLLYGSSKGAGLQPYLIEKIYDFDDTELDIDCAFSDYVMIRNDGKKYKNPSTNIPRLLSTHSVDRIQYSFEPIIPYVPLLEEVEEVEEVEESIEIIDEQNRELIPLISLVKQCWIEEHQRWKKLIFTMVALKIHDHHIHEVSKRTTLGNYDYSNLCHFIKAIQSGKYRRQHEDTYAENLKMFKKMCDMPKENQDLLELTKEKQQDTLKIRYDLLQSDQFVYANAFISKYGMDYKIIDKNISFKWNERTLLWEQHDTENLAYDITILRNDIDDIIDMLVNSDLSPALANKAKINLGNTSFLSNIWKQIYVRLLDKEFLNQVNKSSHELPITNGLKLNLRNGVVSKRTKSDLFSVEIWCLQKPDTTEVDMYMNTLFDNNTEKINFLHTLFGYWMTGNIEQRKMYFLVGVGRNGKSFLMNLFDKIFKGTSFFCSSIMNCAIIKSESHHSKDAKPTPELEPFRKARFGVWNELQQGDKISTPLFKSITGGDPLSHRPMYHRGEPVIFTSQMKGIVCTNILPEFDISDVACMDRPCVIDFPHRYKSPDELTSDEKERLLFLQSAPFLNMFFWYCVDGAIKYYKDGLSNPQCLQVRKSEWVKSLDTTGQFLELYTKDEDKYVLCVELFQHYINWCKDNGHKSKSQSIIGVYLLQNGYNRIQKQVNGSRKWVYIGLSNDEDLE